jgi:hypothetical protein
VIWIDDERTGDVDEDRESGGGKIGSMEDRNVGTWIEDDGS